VLASLSYTLQFHTCDPRAWPDVGFRTPRCNFTHAIHGRGRMWDFALLRADVGFRTLTLQFHTCDPRAWPDMGFRTPPRGCGISHPSAREVGFGVMSTTAGLVFPAAAGDCLNKKNERSSASAQCMEKKVPDWRR